MRGEVRTVDPRASFLLVPTCLAFLHTNFAPGINLAMVIAFLVPLCVSERGGVVPTGGGQEGWRLRACVVLVREWMNEVGLATWACLSYFVVS